MASHSKCGGARCQSRLRASRTRESGRWAVRALCPGDGRNAPLARYAGAAALRSSGSRERRYSDLGDLPRRPVGLAESGPYVANTDPRKTSRTGDLSDPREWSGWRYQ
ncbi:MAG TPA: hypothetical protein VHZ51_06285, partial [Ktedonobacteraceae bacterium]|nr:hypothetical protein [Ktedonobacteraceae bacterium]